MGNEKSESHEVNLPEGTSKATIVINNQSTRGKSVWLKVFLALSIVINVALFTMYRSYFQEPNQPKEKFHSGDPAAADKVAIIPVEGIIYGANTTQILKAIERAREDDAVKAALLAVDSPGGGAPDSHQIYHELKKLSAVKPVYVQMKKYAASGGLYVAMGAGTEGKIFAEPTTWTGSIGVIIPRFDLTGMEDKFGITAAPIKSAPLKDSPSPFRKLTEEEQAVWDAIIKDSLGLFTGVIVENRANLDEEKVEALATGQVYTASQALNNGLVDEIGYEEDSLKALGEKAGFDPEDVRIIEYYTEKTLPEILLGTSATGSIDEQWQALLESTIPRAMYLCSWLPLGAE
ncbi:MAG: signal peptide peptidase SppA [Planctomyces sp.]|nr:signal peptide peptidase SppA [Planctomyces sp.]